MIDQLSQRLFARLAGLLMVGSGVLSFLYVDVLGGAPVFSASAVAISSLSAVVLGAIAIVAPWHKWHTRASLVLAVPTLGLIALGNYYGPVGASYTFGVFFVVTFAWIGVAHGRWTPLLMSPLGIVAYVAPIIIRSPDGLAGALSVILTIPLSVLVGEGLAWLSERERTSYNHAHALARTSAALASQLSVAHVLQTLVDEARTSLGVEHAVLYRLEAGTRKILQIRWSGVGREFVPILQRMRGSSDMSGISGLDALERSEPLVFADARLSDIFDGKVAELFKLKSFMLVPIGVSGHLTGMLFCGSSSQRHNFPPAEVELAKAIAAQAGSAMQNAAIYEQTLKASLCDPLTELHNRRAFHDDLEGELDRCRRHGRQASLVLLDLDNFKHVNDAWGHQTGDRVIVRLAEHLRRTMRSSDGAYRIGGDEFALILPETTSAGAVRIAERLRRAVQRSALGGGDDLRLTVSIGVASFPDGGRSPDELVASADKSLYEVKALGGDACSVFSDGDNLRLGVDLRRALDEGSLRSTFQPIVELGGFHRIGYEAFCQLDPSIGTMPTPTLFRTAGSLGMVIDLDRACRACSLKIAKELEPGMLLFLNLSPAVLEDPTFDPEEILTPVRAAGLSESGVVIEVTEHERSPSSAALATGLRRCREAGFRLALDDLGSGGADLELLASLPFDFVKIDMAFVQGAESSDSRRKLLHGLRLLVDQTGAQAIAEGVETESDLRLVADLGFWGAQGFYLGVPGPIRLEPQLKADSA